MSSYVDELIHTLNLEIISEIETPSRMERRRTLPEAAFSGKMSSILRNMLGRNDFSVWEHQAKAVEYLVNFKNVVVSTGTASGKSLIFQIDALRRLTADPTAKVLVIYPLKALGSDQFSRWKKLVRIAELSDEVVGRIDGNVPMSDRDKILGAARILIMTPDVCHAWFMRNVGSGPVRRFLDGLRLLVLDEAHIYESVFGSNVAFLLRRLIAAKKRISRSDAKSREFQVVATTATLSGPSDHLRLLTGLEFAVIEEDQNGAPHFQRRAVHLSGADYGAAGEAAATDIVRGILSLSERRRFIVFIDSRQGVERVVRSVGDESVLPYRSGYEAHDREKIEKALRDGSLHGVVATSALELGIDIADMEIGVTLGIPQSRKAFHQRLGRVGRAKPGTFMVIASPVAFGRLGLTFDDYFRMPVEPSHLYLGNRFIQFSQARCLLEEMEVLGMERSALPSGASWPDGFAEVLASAKPGAARSREFDFIAQLGADAPHLNYPLRQVGEGSFDIQEGSRTDPDRIGTIAINQAIREAYPGATYLHAGRAYKVYEWRTSRGERAIRVGSSKNEAPTKPILRKQVNLSLQADGIIDGRVMTNETGILAEVYVQVNESVEGYRVGNTTKMYRDLRAENPSMSRKQRDFRTTGLVLRIDEDWFRGSDETQRRIREDIADGLRDLLSSEFGIAPYDIDSASSNIGLLTASGPVRLTDAVVIYDAVYGSLRLTEALYDAFPTYLARLDRGASLAGADAIVSDKIADKLRAWAETLAPAGAVNLANIKVPDGWRLVYKRRSVLGVYMNGVLFERELIEPMLVTFPGAAPSLFYKYHVPEGDAYVPHDQIQPTGQEWGWELWCAETGEFREVEADG
ncbi:DEAD/DEAH box helicase [Limibaculum sp. FT325]|uniref:DEAD/DEAH box helicase n=1 Tax=Thermohalobaculum sediminis TaxID=2939436 RepID=UPI0020BE96E3|nr:DEAD/DEAH box helicase [Limibaculum sediminis]MCL5779284.1 DEAD/DEAH box helicase [Limibaculum sediminis]